MIKIFTWYLLDYRRCATQAQAQAQAGFVKYRKVVDEYPRLKKVRWLDIRCRNMTQISCKCELNSRLHEISCKREFYSRFHGRVNSYSHLHEFTLQCNISIKMLLCVSVCRIPKRSLKLFIYLFIYVYAYSVSKNINNDKVKTECVVSQYKTLKI